MRHVPTTLARIATAILAVVLVIVVAQVFLRYLFAASFGWAEEIVALGVTFAALLAAAPTLFEGKHVRVLLLDTVLPERWRGLVRRATDLVSAGVVGVVAWLAFSSAQFQHAMGAQSMSSWEYPLWVADAVLGLGLGFLALSFLAEAIVGRSEPVGLVVTGLD